jgi:alanine dehydrogenase
MSTPQVLLLDEHDVDDLATTAVALAAARRTAEIVASGELTTDRVQVGDDVIWTRILVGILPTLDLLGYKQFHRIEDQVRYTIHLFRRSTGHAVAMVDGRRITSLRTAATAALAVAHHVQSVAAVPVGVIGSGEEAKEGLRMLAGTVALGGVRVFSPTPANRESYAAELGLELGLPIEPVASVGDALEGAGIAYVATSAASEPFLGFDDIAHVPVVAAIGSTRPTQRELKGDVLARAGHVVVDCADALHEPGDVIEAVEDFGFDVKRAALLGEALTVAADGHARPVVFKSIGSVEQDLVLAHHLVDAATEAGRGRTVDTVSSLRIMR